MREEATAPPLYPTLPASGHDYRIQEITRIQTELRQEASKRASLCKKYKRGINAVDSTDAALVVVGAGLSVGGIGLLASIIAVPIAVGLEAGSLGCAGLCVIGKAIGRKLTAKFDKHRRIETLARAKLNTISDVISQALTDGEISDTEYRMILAEVKKFEDMKREVRSKRKDNTPAIDMEELKKNLLAQGRKEALE